MPVPSIKIKDMIHHPHRTITIKGHAQGT